MKETELQSIEATYLTENDVAKKYLVCKRTLYNMRIKEKLVNGYHYIYVGKQIRYKTNEVHEYFEPTTLTY